MSLAAFADLDGLNRQIDVVNQQIAAWTARPTPPYNGSTKTAALASLNAQLVALIAQRPALASPVASLPAPGLTLTGFRAFASDAGPTPCPVYNDGVNWRRESDDSIVAVPVDFQGYKMSLGIPLYTFPSLKVSALALHNDFGCNGYIVGQVIPLAGGTYTVQAQLTVAAVNGLGGPTAVTFTPGTYTVPPNAEQDFGSGFKVTVTTAQKNVVWNDAAAVAAPRIYLAAFTPDAVSEGAGGTGPGVATLPAFASGVAALKAAGCKVLGYVRTLYTRRAVQDVIADIQRFFTLYGITDIFVDEVADNQFAYYAQLRAAMQAQSFMALNPGTNVVESYLQIADVICCFEDTLANYKTTDPAAYMVNYPRRRFWHLVHTCTTLADAQMAFDLARQRNVGNVFVTDAIMPFPWNPQSAYEAGLLTKLEETKLPFSLIDIPGRVAEFWAANVTKDGGNLVSQMDDHSARKWHLTAAGALRPLWVANQLNGLPVIRFAGAQRLQNDAFSRAQPYTVWAVYKVSTNDMAVIGGAGTSGIYDSAGAGGRASYQAGNFPDGTILVHNQWAIVVGLFSSAAGVYGLRVNGRVSTIADPGANAWVKIALGDYPDDGTHMVTGDIAAAGLFDRVLGPADLALLENYLATITGIAVG